MLDEGVVLLGRTSGEGCEPVGVVACAVLGSPSAHTVGNTVGDMAVKGLFVLDSVHKSVVCALGKIAEHGAAVENQFTVVLLGAL